MCTDKVIESLLPYRHLCYGWRCPSVHQRLWFSRTQRSWIGNCTGHDQTEAFGLSQAWWSHWQRVQHRPCCSSENLCHNLVLVLVESAMADIYSLNQPLLSLDLFKALLALGSPVEHCDASMNAIRTSARDGTYHNPMAISQILPALHQKSYLAVKNKNCQNEDGMRSAVVPHCGQFRWQVFLFSPNFESLALRLHSAGAYWTWGDSA